MIERRELEVGMYASGLSQAEIADLLGISQATVSLDLRKAKKR
jgi:DNA-binding CsgD family transcriptional regulator